MASFLGWLLGVDQAQQGIAQNASKIESLLKASAETRKALEAAQAAQALETAQALEQSAAAAEKVTDMAGKTEELVGNIAELRGEFKDLLDNVDELGGGFEEISEAILETADKMDGLTDALKNLEEVGKAAEGAGQISTAGTAGIIAACVMVIVLVAFVACLVHQGVKAEKERKGKGIDRSSKVPAVGDLISLSDTEEKGSTEMPGNGVPRNIRTGLNGIKEPYQMHNSTTTLLVPVNA